ncbi:hypothetical protein MAP00_003038 [Monascus purpureus]|nr:hypothetical protein MAP00_003038 [Monascus purpureus]
MASNLTEKQAGLVNEHDEFRNYAIPPQPHHEQNFPQGYYRRPLFLGPVTAISFGLMSALAGFAYIAPILTVINDVGLNPNIFWLSLVYTLIIAVGLTIIGRVTDAFGRRYVLIAGVMLGVTGSIVSATAHSIDILISGMVFIGAAAHRSPISTPWLSWCR